MTALRSNLDCYLQVRRRLGFELRNDELLLEGFVEFLERAGAERVSSELAVMWAKLPVDARPYTWRQRLGIVRGFAGYLASIDPVSEVPSKDLLPAQYVRVTPYIYSEAELAALMGAARALSPPPRAATYKTLIGLLAATGLRPGEALGLDRQDVDLRDGFLHVRAAKQQKQREVLLHESTTEALGEYARVRDRHWPSPQTPAFFLNAKAGRLSRSGFNHGFAKLIKQAGLEGCGARARPRPHDLRHRFAVRTLLGWYRDGEDVDRLMPLLSTYMGHANPANTYWYLSASPELMGLVGQRLDRVLGGQL
jgi:integrase/recombinase XerD